MDWAEGEGADVLLLPELAVTGYPPEDLVLRLGFVEDNLDVVRRLAARSGRCTTVVGFVDQVNGSGPRSGRRRSTQGPQCRCGHLQAGEWKATYRKILLPNYGVFDEERYFAPGEEPAFLWEIAGRKRRLDLRRHLASRRSPLQQAEAGAKVLLNINGSPYHHGKAREREQMLGDRARAAGVPVVYLNMVGGQDELVFDGHSWS